jgi:hypothetical protein
MRLLPTAFVCLAALSLQLAPSPQKAVPASLGLAPVVELVAQGCSLGWHRGHWDSVRRVQQNAMKRMVMVCG